MTLADDDGDDDHDDDDVLSIRHLEWIFGGAAAGPVVMIASRHDRHDCFLRKRHAQQMSMLAKHTEVVRAVSQIQ